MRAITFALEAACARCSCVYAVRKGQDHRLQGATYTIAVSSTHMLQQTSKYLLYILALIFCLFPYSY